MKARRPAAGGVTGMLLYRQIHSNLAGSCTCSPGAEHPPRRHGKWCYEVSALSF